MEEILREDVKKEHVKKQNRIAIIVIVVGTILSLILFGPKKKAEPVSVEKPAKIVDVMELGSDETKTAKLVRSVTFDSTDEATVVAEYTGRVTEVYFEGGQYVTAGQILAKFDQSRIENSARTSLENANKNLVLARDNFERTEEVVEESLELAKNARKVAELQLEQAEEDEEGVRLARRNLENTEDAEEQAEKQSEITKNNAQIALNQAQESVAQSRIAHEKTIIRAPVSGIVSSKKIDQSDYISFGQAVAQIVGTGKLKAKVFLNRDEIERVMIGDGVLIEMNDKKFEGRIVSLSPIANGDNGRFEVRIESSEELSGSTNQTAQASFALRLDPSLENSFFAPLFAVNIGQQKNVVFVFEDGKAIQREVKLGQTVDDQIEILEGVSEGEMIIVENNRDLRDGESVILE